MSRTVDPFKLLGSPDTWARFGESEHDAACDAERRAWVDHFIRRLNKGQKRGRQDVGADIMTGASTAMAAFFVSALGGPNVAKESDFDRWIAIMTYAWYQAMAAGATGSVS
jgi:hypothetical protein